MPVVQIVPLARVGILHLGGIMAAELPVVMLADAEQLVVGLAAVLLRPVRRHVEGRGHGDRSRLLLRLRVEGEPEESLRSEVLLLLETLHVHDKHLREVEQSHLLVDRILSSTVKAGALNSLFHSELIEALLERHGQLLHLRSSVRQEAVLVLVIGLICLDKLGLRHLDGQVHVRLKPIALLAALRTRQLVAKLALEQISDNAVISCLVVALPDLGLAIDGLIVAVNLLVCRLDLDAVQLLVDAVEQKVFELLSILLLVTFELFICLSQLLLQDTGRDLCALCAAGLLQEISKLESEAAIDDLIRKTRNREVLKEILIEWLASEQTLENAVHVASVSIILEGNRPVAEPLAREIPLLNLVHDESVIL